MTDEELMAQVRDGTLDHMGELFERYRLAMFRFMYKLAHDQDKAEDLTQQVFYRMIRYRKSYKGTHTFRSWMFRIARNVFYDSCRSTGLDASQNDISAEELARVPAHDSDQTDRLQREDTLRLAMDRLPDEQKELLLMSKFQGMPYEEISEQTGLTVSNIKTKVYRSVKKLREIYFQLA
ncbi:RNA polymerase sigma factor [Fulvitalea axinellae]|uniref:RNA polymerase sigma factor n=1 Tax=Fulvitalea axinellae TaxID=1182444 RepID=A0AAU9DHJ1_9BACT|nr:RNA polymerase sigma factor [Fulvitalea axinellae]